MALPTCPSCKQSVIDDDATECPFCGSSMKAKPAAKGAPVSSATASAKPTTAAKPAAKPQSTGDDNPFDSPAPVMGKSIQLLAKPDKGKLHRVVCPMCETAGFTSKKAAGREVRCANEKCLVPTFTAPRLEEESEPVRGEEPKTEKKPMPLMLKATFVAVFGGAFLWALATFVLFPEKPKQDDVVVLPPDTGGGTNTTTNNGDGKTDQPDNGKKDTTPVVAQGPSVAELRTKALATMVRLSQKTEAEGNDNKPLCRTLTAEAYAVAGNLDEVSAQLKQLGELINGPQLRYFGILPLIETAWPKVAAGKMADAGLIVSQIQELMPSVPSNRSIALDIVTEFSVLLAAMDRRDEAAKLITQRHNEGPLGQFMESFARCQFTRTFDLNQAVELRPVGGWTAPQWVAVTVGLVGRGHSDKALAWARSAPSPRAVYECVSAWAEATLLISKDAASLVAVNKEIDGIAEPARSWVKARVGLTLALIGLAEPAKAMIAEAAISLDPAQAPAEFSLPGMIEIYRLAIPDPESGRIRTLAAAELAHANLVLGDKAAAWSAITIALAHARNLAPSNVLMAQLFADMKRQGEAALSQTFKESLNVLTVEAGRTAYIKYRATCTSLSTLADLRLKLQQEVLLAAIDWDFIKETWTEIKGRASAIGAKRETWYETGIPSILQAEFQGLGDTALMTEIEKNATSGKLKTHVVKRASYNVLAWKHLAEGNPQSAIKTLNAFKADSDADVNWLSEIMLRQATQLAAKGDFDSAVKYVFAINNNEKHQRGIALELIATQASMQGKSDALFSHALVARRYPPDGVSILRGFIEGVRGK